MKKKVQKFCAIMLSIITLSSMVTLATTSVSAEEKDVSQLTAEENTDSQQKTRDESQTINSFDSKSQLTELTADRATGDIRMSSEEIAEMPVIKSTDDYYQTVDNSSQNSRAAANNASLSQVDNSQSIYFPEIGDQGTLGSCTCWANIYYQLSYMENRELNRAATEDNSLSATWMYPLVNSGSDFGSSAGDVLEVASQIGAVTQKTSPVTTDYLKWNTGKEIYEEAQQYRISDYSIFYTGAGDTPITSPDDSDIAAIKAALQNGEILTFSTYIAGWNYEQIEENSQFPENSKYKDEYIATYAYGIGGAHRMTVVGYNDNIWVDINHNGEAEKGEMGAFKIANSWGTEYEYGNDGFIWLSYDMLNTVSSVDNVYLRNNRANAGAEYMFSSVVKIDVMPAEQNSNINLEYTLNTSSRNLTNVYVVATNDNETYSELIEPFSGRSTGNYSFDGTNTAVDGTFVYDLSNIVPDLNSESFNDYNWYIEFVDNKPYSGSNDGTLTIKNVKITDNNNNTTYSVNNFKNNITINNSQVIANIENGYSGSKDLTLDLTEFSASCGKSVCQYDRFSVGAWAKGGSAPYEYKFSYVIEGEETVLSDYSQSNVIPTTFTKAGSYTLKVSVKDDNGQVKNAEIPFTVKKTEITDIQIYSGTTEYGEKEFYIVPTIKNMPESIPPYNIRYTVSKDGDEDVILNSYYDNQYAGCWTPDDYGTYDITAYIKKDSAVIASKTIEYTLNKEDNPLNVYEFRISHDSYDDSLGDNEIDLGREIIFSAWASGGKAPYQYKFGYIQNGRTVYVSNYSSYAQFTYDDGIKEVTTITPFVTVKDADGDTVTKKLGENKVVGGLKITGISVGNNSIVNVNKSVYINCSYKRAADFTDVEVIIKKDGHTVQELSNICPSWTPTETGSYTITVNLRDSIGQTASKTISCNVVGSDNTAKIYYKGYDTPYIHYQVDGKSWSQAPGYPMIETQEYPDKYTHMFTIDLDNASGANICFNDGNGNWDSRNGQNYRLEAGIYTYSNGNLTKVDADVLQIKRFTVNSGKNEYNQPYSSRVEGMNFSVEATGGTAPYTYEFGYIDDGIKITSGYKNYSSAAMHFPKSCVITPFVRVKDAAGAVVEQTAQTIKVNGLTVDLSTEETSYTVNEPIHFKTDCDNLVLNVAYSATYIYSIEKDGKLVGYLKNYGQDISWTPTEAGKYTVNVCVIDGIGQVKNDYITLNVTDKLKIDSFDLDPEKGYASIYDYANMSASASGGTAPYQYKFSYFRTGSEYIISDYSDNNRVSKQFEEMGFYHLRVTVKDANGNTAFAEKNFSVNQTYVLKLNADKNTIKAGDTVTFSAVTTNEASVIKPENYFYTVTKDGVTQKLTVSSDKTASWMPTEAGEYTVHLDIKYNGKVIAFNSLKYTVEENPSANFNLLTIYYKGYSTPYIHYQVGNGNWTDVPGCAMTATSGMSGYTHKYTINLGDSTYANVCFNDGNGNWDSKNGQNYRFESGTYTYSNGTLTKIS